MKCINLFRGVVLTSLLSYGTAAVSQFNGATRLHYQWGGLPADTFGQYASLYTSLGGRYTHEDLTTFARVEHHQTPVSDRNYTQISRYGADYKYKRLRFKTGHFYETIGRGLILRSFEIPGTLLEDPGFRVKQAFYRDIRGFSIRYNGRKQRVLLLRGQPLNPSIPPTFSDRDKRNDQLEALIMETKVLKQWLSYGVLRWYGTNDIFYYPYYNMQGTVNGMTYFIEATKRLSSEEPLAEFNEQSSYGAYGSFGFLLLNQIGVTVEYKQYHNLILGSGFNEPALATKEQRHRLLNRSSHVLFPQDEKGYLVDVLYDLNEKHRFNISYAYALNTFATDFRYNDWFVEWSFHPDERQSMTLFGDRTQNPFEMEQNKHTSGIELHKQINGTHLSLVYEYQSFKRSGELVHNQVLSGGFAWSRQSAVHLTMEMSDDRLQSPTTTRSYWLGADFVHHFTPAHSLMVFAGTRRGGPACIAGICYEVLDFEGVEIKWYIKI